VEERELEKNVAKPSFCFIGEARGRDFQTLKDKPAKAITR
jgi:hypothetical protein